MRNLQRVALAGIIAVTASACNGVMLRRNVRSAGPVDTSTARCGSIMRRSGAAVLVSVIAVSSSACVRTMLGHGGVQRPPAAEFGLGPRTSTHGLYTATLQPAQPLRPRQMQTIHVAIRDANGHPVDDATITVDGGMPEHGHGLPTRPRMTKRLGEGVYAIEGVRFNMGGWWEFKLAVTTAAGDDGVTFNLSL